MSISERVVCTNCGANNFATQAACWKCGKSLALSTSPASPPGSSPPLPGAIPTTNYQPPVAYGAVSNDYSPGTATTAAIVLGLLFPMVALPVGIVFLMLDNKRKAAIGWQNIIWGIVGSVLNIIITIASFTPAITFLMSKSLAAQQQSGGNVMQKIQQQQQNNLQELGQ